MDVYGLTGGIGSGKSTVAALLEDYGVPVVSADELSRVVVARGSEGLQAVVEAFGEEVVDEHGELDRRRMASIVFQNTDRRRQLEAILHPRIRDRFEQVLDALEKAGHEVAVYEVPLLFERNLQGEMKAVVLVTAPLDDRVARVRSRDDVTETEVRARIAAQMDEDAKRRRADYIIENNGSLDDLRREVEFLMSRFLRITQPTAVEPAQAQSNPVVTGMTMPPVSGAPGAPPVEVPSASPSPPPPPLPQQPPQPENLQSRRPTAVPTGAPASIAAPVDPAGSGRLVESDAAGPPTIVDTGPPHANPDTVHPVSPTPPPPPGRDRPLEELPAEQRITQIDTGPPKK